MTWEDLQKMSIEEILHLPNLISITNSEIDNNYLGPRRIPHWELRFIGERRNDGTFSSTYNISMLFTKWLFENDWRPKVLGSKKQWCRIKEINEDLNRIEYEIAENEQAIFELFTKTFNK